MARRRLPALAALSLLSISVPREAFAIGELEIVIPPIQRSADCTDYRAIDAANGRSSTVCLPVERYSLGISAPQVYCREATCVITGAAVADPAAFLRAFAGAAESGDNCRTYDVFEPGRGNARSGVLCIPVQLDARTFYCAGKRCVAVEP